MIFTRMDTGDRETFGLDSLHENLFFALESLQILIPFALVLLQMCSSSLASYFYV